MVITYIVSYNTKNTPDILIITKRSLFLAMSKHFFIDFIQQEETELTYEDKIELLKFVHRNVPTSIYESPIGVHIALKDLDNNTLKEIFMILCNRHCLNPEEFLN